ncbi:MAG: hypothetical protein ACI4N6_04600 [Eubacteriales bacterium]
MTRKSRGIKGKASGAMQSLIIDVLLARDVTYTRKTDGADRKMIIEQFNIWHISVLMFTVALTAGLWLLLRKRTEKTKYYAVLAIELFNLLLYIFRIFLMYKNEGGSFNVWNNLPLYLCDFSLIINLAAMLFKNKLFYHYAYFIASIGGLMALLFPSRAFVGYSLLDVRIFAFYLQHILVANGGILMYMLGFFRIDIKRTALTNVFLFAFAIVCHCVNVFITQNGLGSPNYMFTLNADGIPILELFRSWIDVDLWYLVPSLAILAVTDVILSLPCIIRCVVSKSKA